MNSEKPILPRVLYQAMFTAGIFSMTVAGWYLVIGLTSLYSQGDTQVTLVIGGALIQLVEASCFFFASTLGKDHKKSRVILLFTGVLIACFSMTIITFAQKATMQVGEAHNNAIVHQITQLESEINNIDRVVKELLDNAANQSASIYAASRAEGAKAAQIAAEHVEKKRALRQELATLYSKQLQNSESVFLTIQEITGLTASSAQFYFMVAISFMVELCGIFFISLASFTRRIDHLSQEGYLDSSKNSEDITPSTIIPFFNKRKNGVDYNLYSIYLRKLIETGKLSKITQQSVKDALKHHYDISIGTPAARKLIKMFVG